MDDRIYEDLDQVAPRCLADFSAVLKDKVSRGEMRGATFEISCGQCQSEIFAISLLTRHWNNGELTSGIGLIARCAKCGHKAALFDGTKQGYDGECGGLEFMAGQDDEAPLDGPPSNSRVRLAIAKLVESIADQKPTVQKSVGQKSSVQKSVTKASVTKASVARLDTASRGERRSSRART